MKRTYLLHLHLLSYALLLLWQQAAAQGLTITGTITNQSTGDKIPGVSIGIKGSSVGTITDKNGKFQLITSRALPLTLVISSIGFRTEEIRVIDRTELNISLRPAEILGQEVVVSASRVPERILESPVSIERLGTRAIRESPAPSFYDMIGNLKGVDVVTSSITLTTPTTRGFGGSGNTRFNQFVDGMDNQAPGLNFSVGNVIGLSELDIDNVELLPGAASALYGAGGTNGTLLMTSKNPFRYQGFSALVTQGVMHLNDPQQSASPYGSYAFRFAKAFNNKFAFKINTALLLASDWQASDDRNYDRAARNVKPGNRNSDPNYDGVNVYGDEISANMQAVAQSVLAAAAAQYAAQYQQNTGSQPSQAQINAFLASNPQTAPFYLGLNSGSIPSQNVSRTGYNEKALVDYNARNIKIGGALHYKFNDKLEAIAQANWGSGTSVYTGADRYSLRNFKIGQYKLELKGNNFYIRAYTTQENAGEAYNGTVLAQLINESWRPSTQWFPLYVGTYVGAKKQGASDAQAHAAARAAADKGRLTPGTDGFENAKESIRRNPIPKGALFTDKSNLYQYDAFYNLSEKIKVFELQIGASFRRYSLNSNGTLFADTTGSIKVDEYGAFLQAGKKLLNEKLKLSASTRYDKNQNFKGRFTPRFSAVYTVVPENYLRASYQTGFRNPTNQNQYINLNTGNALLIGGIEAFRNYYNFNNNPVYTAESVVAFRNAYSRALTQGQSPAQAYAQAQPLLTQYRFGEFKPERVQSFELGYRGLISKKLLIDAYYYFSQYNDFLGYVNVIQSKPKQGPPSQQKLLDPRQSQVYNVPVNHTASVNAQGWALGIDYLLPGHYLINSNLSYNRLTKVPDGFEAGFNTPEYRFNLGFGNNNVYKDLGFNLQFRYQSSFRYEGAFGAGTVPAFSTLDAQVNYKFTQIKSMLKIGGSNIFNHYYQNAFGNPNIGGLYYISMSYNAF